MKETTPMTETLRPDRTILATADAAFLPYERYGAPIEGLSWLPLSGGAGDGYESYLIRFAPGARSRPHRHEGTEEFMVLEGELHDSDGTRFRAGDFVRFEPGSEHWSHSPEGCLLLVVLRGGTNRALPPGAA